MKKNQFIPFSAPDIGEDEIAEVVQCLRSGWITTGIKAKQFEADFSNFLGGGVECLAVNSATAGLHLALEAIGIGLGDEVITTTHTFTATAEVIRYLGAEPVFVDIDESSLCISLDQIEKAITKRTKAIIPVHFAGLAADMQAILELAKRYGLRVVEDAAHALPTTSCGKLIGTLESDATVFSFYANKTITTGEGGMLVTRNPDIAARVKIMRLHGINRDAFDRFTSKVPSWHYEIIAPGYKYNMTDIAAAMGIHQLKKANSFQNRRRNIANIYKTRLANLPIILPPEARDGDVHSWHLFTIRLDTCVKTSRDKFIEYMFDRSIGCSVHYIPLHLHPYWRDRYNLAPEHFPISQKVYERTVSLPLFSKMTDQEVDVVINAVHEILK